MKVAVPTGTLPSDAERVVDVPAGGCVAVEIGLTPPTAPFCPLEVSFGGLRPSEPIDPFPVPLWLDVHDA